jgi:exodeoxyribonuclease VII large subunit
MQPKGMGALQLAFEKLKQKLEAEGLFESSRKKPLPKLPRRIGVVTSPTGAAIRDILHVLKRRFANVQVLLYPARVQGEGAAREIIAGIRALDAWGVDVMIVGRGGGSLEDLWPFNEEPVVRAVAAVKTPVISAVGHEIDFTLTDFAADLRAPTPSAAAELVVQEQEALLEQVRLRRRQLAAALSRNLERYRHRLQVAQSSYCLRRPEELLRQRRQTADELRLRLDSLLQERLSTARIRLDRAQRALGLLSPWNRLRQAKDRLGELLRRVKQSGCTRIDAARRRLLPAAARLDALSPLAILSRGYVLAWRLPERSLVREAGQLSIEDEVYLRFGAGSATAVVKQIEDIKDGTGEKKSEF